MNQSPGLRSDDAGPVRPGTFRAVVDEAASCILVQREERILFANGAALDCLGWPALEEIPQAHLAELFEPASYATLCPNLRKIVPDDDQLFIGELKLKRRDGLLVDAEVHHHAIPNEPEGTSMLTFRDVTIMKGMEAELASTMRALEEREATITADLREARAFQQHILAAPPAAPGFDFEVIYRPLGLVGGDLYDLHLLDDARLRLFIADATGHGVQAALATMMIKCEYERAKRAPTDAEVLGALNESISGRYSDCKVLFTALSLTIDLRARTLSCSNGGHPAPLVRRGSAEAARWSALDQDGSFLGMMPGVPFENATVPFGPGDGVFLFSDGAYEVSSPTGAIFGDARLAAALAAAEGAGGRAGAELCRQLDVFGEGAPLADDLTFIAVRWQSEPQ